MRTLASPEALVLVMVGLPARGKTFIARKVARYLGWLGIPARVFNVGNYRRDRLGATQPASFFDPDNADGVAARRALAVEALDDLSAWISAGRVAIYDATNVTRARRAEIASRLAERGLAPVFVETVCDDAAVIEANIRETKLSMPDYAGVDPDAAVADFRARIRHYERAYEPLAEEEGSWVRIVDLGRQVVANRISGYLASRLVFFLSNLHVTPRPILLTRHGESAFNVERRVGGDPPLTERGMAFAGRLAAWLREQWPGANAPQVWTSTLRRSITTAAAVGWPTTVIKNLDEIDAGAFDGWSYDEIEVGAPAEAAARRADKYRYRYPRGESYEDLIARLEPVIIELERQRGPVVIVGHQAVIRCLYAYLTDVPPEECPHVAVPLHTVITLVPRAYGATETRTPV